ncbi:hypothetical protein LTR08_000949 [Meristemomyces frigidus]|nr:hypothetical protein LTR08_000949 [Meristemomyces frigidus]
MPMSSTLNTELLSFAILGLIYVFGGDGDLWTTLFIVDDLCAVITSGWDTRDPEKAAGSFTFKRVL